MTIEKTSFYPAFWSTEKLAKAMYNAGMDYEGKNDWKVARMFTAVAIRLRNYDQWEKAMEQHDTAEVKNKLVIPNDGGTGESLMNWLSYTHLQDELQETVQMYHKLGLFICNTIAPGPERTVALRKLVESKDCAVRAVIEAKKGQE